MKQRKLSSKEVSMLKALRHCVRGTIKRVVEQKCYARAASRNANWVTEREERLIKTQIEHRTDKYLSKIAVFLVNEGVDYPEQGLHNLSEGFNAIFIEGRQQARVIFKMAYDRERKKVVFSLKTRGVC